MQQLMGAWACLLPNPVAVAMPWSGGSPDFGATGRVGKVRNYLRSRSSSFPFPSSPSVPPHFPLLTSNSSLTSELTTSQVYL